MSEDSGEKVPLWIISFADMITLLMSFFVMLQTMATTQDNTLFGASRDSFRRVVAGYGIPDILFGKETGPKFDYRKIRYPTDEAPESKPPNRVIDADDETIRRLFNELAQQNSVKVTDVPEHVAQITPSRVRFAAGSAAVDGDGKGKLADFAAGLRQSRQAAATKVYVIAPVKSGGGDKESLMLAARRAAAVEEALRTALAGPNGQCDWQVASWGTPSAKESSRALGASGEDTGILLVVMEAKNNGG